MKASKYMIQTLRAAPSEAVIASHQLMLKAGLVQKLANGLYAYMPMGLRALNKVIAIINKELQAIDALPIKPTVVVPGELWQKSSRWDTMGPQMLKARNRQGQDMVISPTAEEAFTYIVKESLTSYKQLPLCLYQINTKYRDEIRPRYGVMRSREFLMMDAYSFNKDPACLDKSYQDMAKAYKNIFKKLDLDMIIVKADSGAMGGDGSEEFMTESPVGDDTLIICPKCSYAANDEKATCQDDPFLDDNGKPFNETLQLPQEVATPNVFSIEDMERFFATSPKRFIKCLIYKAINSKIDGLKTNAIKTNATEKEAKKHEEQEKNTLFYFCVAIRGDLEVNETKLCNALQASEVALADEAEVLECSGTVHGFVGATTCKVPVIMDNSVPEMHDCITGAGKKDTHLLHVEPKRDIKPFLTCDIRTVNAGDRCPLCGGGLYSKKGNELGHIFKLGDKYTKAFDVTYLDQEGLSKTAIMGCYGIGVDRTLASIIEKHNDKDGIIWPLSVAPFSVCLVPIQYKDKMKQTADKIYSQLLDAGIEVILDDRDLRPGVKFKDWDLIGIPYRIVIGDKNLPQVELKQRSQKETKLLDQDTVATQVSNMIKDALKDI